MNIQLSISCSLLQGSSLRRVMKAIIDSQQSIFYKQTNQHPLAEEKIRSICTTNSSAPSMYSIRIWDSQDLLTPGLLDSQSFNVVVKSQQDQKLNLGRRKGIIVVGQIQQLSEIFSLSLFELEKRCKLEYLERVSHQRYLEQNAKQTLKLLAEKVIQKFKNSSLKDLIRHMRFHTTKREITIKKYFTLWMIFRYQNSLESLNQELISQKYLTEGSSSQLLKQCFVGWKNLSTENR